MNKYTVYQTAYSQYGPSSFSTSVDADFFHIDNGTLTFTQKVGESWHSVASFRTWDSVIKVEDGR